MRPFLHDDFLLSTPAARRLYHEHAARQPILDYHSHVATAEVAADRAYANLTELWIAPDQYKHRALRALGVPETYITGSADPEEKFQRWAAAVPQTLGHPLFHWTALELKRTFEIDELLTPASAAAIWQAANARLRQPSHRARGLLTRAGVEVICSSDRLLDDLSAHIALAREPAAPRIVPSLRLDDLLAVEADTFPAWIRQLGDATGQPIRQLDDLLAAVERKLDDFGRAGCRLSDHGIDVFDYESTSADDAAPLLQRRLAGENLTPPESARLRSCLLHRLGLHYARRGWTQQLHLGAQRTTSSRLRRIAGPAGGYATIGNTTDVARLARFLDDLERDGGLPRTILFNLNPAENAALATLTGSFTAEGRPGLVQFGPAWWFNDHALGIRDHLETLAHHGLLATFVGMTTDSRSLLSMSRHEYFRRVLCDHLGAEMERGRFPADDALVGGLVRRVCGENARAYLFS